MAGKAIGGNVPVGRRRDAGVAGIAVSVSVSASGWDAALINPLCQDRGKESRRSRVKKRGVKLLFILKLKVKKAKGNAQCPKLAMNAYVRLEKISPDPMKEIGCDGKGTKRKRPPVLECSGAAEVNVIGVPKKTVAGPTPNEAGNACGSNKTGEPVEIGPPVSDEGQPAALVPEKIDVGTEDAAAATPTVTAGGRTSTGKPEDAAIGSTVTILAEPTSSSTHGAPPLEEGETQVLGLVRETVATVGINH